MAELMGAKEVAQELGTTPRELRKFLRDFLPKEEQPGQGGRYAFSKADVKKLAKGFKALGTKTAAAKKETEAPTPPAAVVGESKTTSKKGKAKATPTPPVEDEDVIELEDLEDLDGPSDEELEEGDDDTDSED